MLSRSLQSKIPNLSFHFYAIYRCSRDKKYVWFWRLFRYFGCWSLSQSLADMELSNVIIKTPVLPLEFQVVCNSFSDIIISGFVSYFRLPVVDEMATLFYIYKVENRRLPTLEFRHLSIL